MPVHTTSFPMGRKMKNLFYPGLRQTENIHYQLSPEELIADTLSIGQGVLSDSGALVINIGRVTGRSPKDKFIVRDDITENTGNGNEFNISIEPHYRDI